MDRVQCRNSLNVGMLFDASTFHCLYYWPFCFTQVRSVGPASFGDLGFSLHFDLRLHLHSMVVVARSFDRSSKTIG